LGPTSATPLKLAGKTATKTQSVLEEIAYRDTWQRGISSYLSMMYERLKLIHSLLAEDGSIYVHVDHRVNSLIRILLDDIFGRNNFINEIAWKRANTVKGNTGQGSQFF
jgi:adenine-specific DNA-methyltransferase